MHLQLSYPIPPLPAPTARVSHLAQTHILQGFILGVQRYARWDLNWETAVANLAPQSYFLQTIYEQDGMYVWNRYLVGR